MLLEFACNVVYSLAERMKRDFFLGGVFFGLLLVAGAGEKIQSLLLDLKNASN